MYFGRAQEACLWRRVECMECGLPEGEHTTESVRARAQMILQAGAPFKGRGCV